MADAGPIYEGVRFVRTIVLLDKDLVLVVDAIDSDRKNTQARQTRLNVTAIRMPSATQFLARPNRLSSFFSHGRQNTDDAR